MQAIVAEEENSNKNDDGIYIETTTVTFRKVVANKEDNLPGNKNAQIVDIRQTSQVNGPLNLKSIEDKAEDAASKKPDVKPLEKLTRKDDTDVEVEDELLDLQKLSDIEVYENFQFLPVLSFYIAISVLYCYFNSKSFS